MVIFHQLFYISKKESIVKRQIFQSTYVTNTFSTQVRLLQSQNSKNLFTLDQLTQFYNMQYTPCHYSNILFEVYRNHLDITQSLQDIFNQTYLFYNQV